MYDLSAFLPIVVVIGCLVYEILFAIAFNLWLRRRGRRRPSAATASPSEMISYWLPALIICELGALSGVGLITTGLAMIGMLSGPDGQGPLIGCVIGVTAVLLLSVIYDVIWVARIRSGHRGNPFDQILETH